jgi:hypothetical protein
VPAQHPFAISGPAFFRPPSLRGILPWHEHTTTIGDFERRPLARSRVGTDIRPTHGVHPLRHHRCRRPAEPAGATGAVKRRWRRAMAMSADARNTRW